MSTLALVDEIVEKIEHLEEIIDTQRYLIEKRDAQLNGHRNNVYFQIAVTGIVFLYGMLYGFYVCPKQ
jgi:tetrahydromethanopterin S-methyltransferase subunit B